jgi:hypothetical protein
MLKPIHHVVCSPALAACQQLMRRFSLWLCDPTITDIHVNQQGLQPPVLATVIESNWLWGFLQRVDAGQPLVRRAQALAAMSAKEKSALAVWVQTVSSVPLQFQPAPAAWPVSRPSVSEQVWKAFNELMEAFYEKGFRSGLPFLADGTPTAIGGVTYENFVLAFRVAHRLTPNLNAREVCVLCGGPLGETPHVDHWIIKSAYPLLSVCADNLQLICNTCNEAPNKGAKPVHSAGSFVDWFHPYFRPGNGTLQLDYVLPEFEVKCSVAVQDDEPRAAKLDALLNLASRWTREFKAEYAKHHDVLLRRERRRVQLAQVRHTLAEIQTYVQQCEMDLVPSEPHHEVHRTLVTALQDPSRLAAWHNELGLVS